MAMWQFEYMIIPKGRRLEDYLEEQLICWKGIEITGDSIIKLNELLPKEKGWSDDIHQYGNSNSTCIEISYEDGDIDEISCRLDLRSLSKVLLSKIVEYIKEIKGEVLYKGDIYEANMETLLDLMRNSEEAKFCKDPKDYFAQMDKK